MGFKARSPVAPRERVGYEVDYGAPRHRVGYAVDTASPRAVRHVELEPWWRRVTTEERLGLLIFGGGAIWAAKVETIQISNFLHLLLTPGPLELSATGVLIWLHAKWRRSVRVK